jgi:hypothetical protein
MHRTYQLSLSSVSHADFSRWSYTSENLKVVVFDIGHTLLYEVFSNAFKIPVLRLELGNKAARNATIKTFESSNSCILFVSSLSVLDVGTGYRLSNLSCKQVVHLGHNDFFHPNNVGLKLLANACGSEKHAQGRFIVVPFSEDPLPSKRGKYEALQQKLNMLKPYE